MPPPRTITMKISHIQDFCYSYDMRTIISILSILGITIGAVGTWYLSGEKVVIDTCGRGGGPEGITDVCTAVYGTSPWIWLFISILIVATVGLISNLMIKSSKYVRKG